MRNPTKLAAATPDPIQVGSFFLETLTTGMYEDPFHCIREYIQNGFDAIRDVVRAGSLEADEGRILISIGGTARAPSLTIRDNGGGIVADRAYSTLVSLGASRKTPALHAGFRGIGRLAGIAYCTTLRFTTKAVGESVATVVQYDCGRIRGYFSPGAEPVDVREVMRSSVRHSTQPAGEAEHYTEVEMLGLVNLGVEFVDLAKLQAYLRSVGPVEYADGFEFADRVRALANGFGDPIPTIHLETKQKRERTPVLKPFKNSYATGRKNVWSRLHDIETFTSREHGWYGWIGVSNFPGEIVDDAAAGVRFRIKNIQVGDAEIIEALAEELTAAGSERRLQPWAVGEIFLTNPQVVPNARRDGFEDGAAWRLVRKDIKEQVVKRVIKLVRSASTTRSAMKGLADILAKATDDAAVEVLDRVAKAKLETLIKRQIETLSNPEKLVGADPKEVSNFTSKFKELAEALAKRPVQQAVVPDTRDDDDDAGAGTKGADDGEGGREGDDADQGGGGSGGDAVGPTRAEVILAALVTELPRGQAARLSGVIEERLSAAGL